MAQATWESLFSPDAGEVRVGLFGSVLVQDYLPGSPVLANGYSPFDSSTGQLSSTLLTTDGWQDLGYLNDAGVVFTPTFTTAKTNAWQTRREIREDATAVDETAMLTALQTNPVVEALYNNIPLGQLSAVGTPGWQITPASNLSLIYRSVLFIAVDGAGDTEQYTAKFYPRALMNKQEKQTWAAKSPVDWGMTFAPYPDPITGFTLTQWHDGPGWRAQVSAPNPVTALSSTSKTTTSVTLGWTAPVADATHGAATSYTVSTTLVSGGTAVGSPVTVSAPTTTATVSGLTTATAYNFSVVANNASGASSATSIQVTTS